MDGPTILLPFDPEFRRRPINKSESGPSYGGEGGGSRPRRGPAWPARSDPRPPVARAEEEKWWSVLTRYTLAGRDIPVEIYLSASAPPAPGPMVPRWHPEGGIWVAARVGAIELVEGMADHN